VAGSRLSLKKVDIRFPV
jgi:hypothetical protein